MSTSGIILHLCMYIAPLYCVNLHGAIPSKHSHIRLISALCRNIDVNFRYRADIHNCTVKFFSQILSIQWIINVNPFSISYCKHIVI